MARIANAEGTAYLPTQSIRTDYDIDNPAYVFQVLKSPDESTAAASLSNQTIKLFAVAEAQLVHAKDLSQLPGRVSEIVFPFPSFSFALYTSCADGTVVGWDTREGREVERYNAPGQELHCVSVCEHAVAAGSEGAVYFWDRRTGRQLTCFSDTHMEAVTQVKFHPLDATKLCTASEDGLVAIFDLTKGLSEDHSFQAAMNINQAVAEVGFYGTSHERLWCRSCVESFHLWHWLEACTSEADAGGGPSANCMAARQQLSEQAAASQLRTQSAQGLAHVDYLIGCERAADGLVLWAGSSSGTAAAFPVLEVAGGACSFGAARAYLAGGHNDVVRSVTSLTCGTTLTGGEDSRVCCWNLPGTVPSNAGTAYDGKARRDGVPAARPKPY